VRDDRRVHEQRGDDVCRYLTPEFSYKHTTTIAARPHPKSACQLQHSLDGEAQQFSSTCNHNTTGLNSSPRKLVDGDCARQWRNLNGVASWFVSYSPYHKPVPPERKIAESSYAQRIRIRSCSQLIEVKSYPYHSLLGHAVESDAQETAWFHVSDKPGIGCRGRRRRQKSRTFIARHAPTADPQK